MQTARAELRFRFAYRHSLDRFARTRLLGTMKKCGFFVRIYSLYTTSTAATATQADDRRKTHRFVRDNNRRRIQSSSSLFTILAGGAQVEP